MHGTSVAQLETAAYSSGWACKLMLFLMREAVCASFPFITATGLSASLSLFLCNPLSFMTLNSHYLSKKHVDLLSLHPANAGCI